MADMAIWQGFDYRWRHHAHRLNRFGSFLENFSATTAGHLKGYYVSRLRVGTIDDTGEATAYLLGLRSETLQCIHGFVTQHVMGHAGTPQLLEAPRLSIPLPASAGTPYIATPLLRGFDLRCTSFERGLHTRGFGFDLAEPQQTAATLSFVPRFFIFPDSSPDPLTRNPATYAYLMTAFYTVVYAPATQAQMTLDSDAAPSLLWQHLGPRQPQRPPPQISLNGQGGGAFNRGFVGLRGFRWELLPWSFTRYSGRYLRHLQCCIETQTYNDTTGQATFASQLWFTNQGAVAYGFNARHWLFTTLVQFNDARAQIQDQSLYNEVRGDDEVWQAFTVG